MVSASQFAAPIARVPVVVVEECSSRPRTRKGRVITDADRWSRTRGFAEAASG
jgi:hypothetical protein